jgi:hypothetical protein
MIAPTHIKKHGISTAQYKLDYPNAVMRIQTEQSKNKMSKSKTGLPGKNKGVIRSEAYKEKMSKSIKSKYDSGETIHWNTGNTTSETTKLKISIGNKNAFNAGNLKQQEQKHKRMHQGAESFNCSIHTINEETKITSAHCNTCGLDFSFTNQIFYPSRLEKINKLCPSCQPRETFSSISEREVLSFIKEYYNGIIIANDREQLGGKEIDIYLPELKLGFEFTGLYWHAEKQNAEKNHLLWKQQFASKQGIRLITIFEDEWLMKADIVKSRISGMLGKHQETFNGRTTEIKTVSSSEAQTFLLNNHIQGKDSSTFKIGLYCKSKLIMLATFKKSNMVKGGDGSSWELSRLCSKLNTRVRGGASKLIKHFQSNFNSENLQLLSYADSRWSSGDLYKTIGFEFKGTSAPSYWYMKDYKTRIHRSSLMKHKLVKNEEDKLLTEWQLAQCLGYDRIWDCGTTKWVLNNK